VARKQPTPKICSLKARSAAYTSWANTEDPSARTAPGRAKFLDRFEEQFADLPEPERKRRAEHARKAYFTMLAAKSAEVRRARKRAS
jgi:hypothetical protein